MYEWDPKKAKANAAKHGVPFESADAFDWQSAKTIDDDKHNDDEPRFLSFGFIGERLCVMYWTPRGENIRIIGLRKANKRERKVYGES